MRKVHPIFGAILDDFARIPQIIEAAEGDCPTCGGIGEIGAQMNYDRCPDCDGTGDAQPRPGAREAYINAAQPVRPRR